MKKLLTILFLSCFLVSCGFTPLHQLNNEHDDTLLSVKVKDIKSEKPYLLRRYLENELNPNNIQTAKSTEINVTISKAIESLITQADSTVTRQNLVVDASFELKDLKKGKVFKTGSTRVVIAFGNVSSPFASFYKEEKAFDDAMKETARAIKAHVIVALQNK